MVKNADGAGGAKRRTSKGREKTQFSPYRAARVAAYDAIFGRKATVERWNIGGETVRRYGQKVREGECPTMSAEYERALRVYCKRTDDDVARVFRKTVLAIERGVDDPESELKDCVTAFEKLGEYQITMKVLGELETNEHQGDSQGDGSPKDGDGAPGSGEDGNATD